MKNPKGWNRFLEQCLSCKKAKELEALFSLFLTFEEREMISSRAIILEQLLENKRSQREIAEHFDVSIAQITRGSNALKSISPQYKEKIISYFKPKEPK